MFKKKQKNKTEKTKNFQNYMIKKDSFIFEKNKTKNKIKLKVSCFIKWLFIL